MVHSRCSHPLATVIATVFMTFGSTAPLLADDAAEDPSRQVSYYREIRPIFQEHCHGCHQPAKTRGDYVMTEFSALLAGGESGEPAVNPGHPEASYLVQQITPDGEAASMPKGKAPLGQDQIALIRRWVEQGAGNDKPASTRQLVDMDHPPRYESLPVVTSIDFSSDGQWLAVSGYHEVLIHKSDGSALVSRLVGLSERIESAVFSPDASLLAVTGGSPGRMGELQVWDVERAELQLSLTITYDTIYGASWSPDGQSIALGCSDQTVRVIDLNTESQILYSRAHTDWVLDTVFSAEGDRVVSVGRDMTVKLTDVATQRFLGNITTHTPGVLRGGMNAVDCNDKNEVVAVGADGAPKLFRSEVTAAPSSGGNPNQIREYDALPGRGFDVRFSADGIRIVAGSSYNGRGEVRVYRAEDGEQLVSLPDLEGGIYAVAFSPDGTTIAFGGFAGHISLADASSGEIAKQFVPVPLENQQ